MKSVGEKGTLISPSEVPADPTTLETEFPESGEEKHPAVARRTGALEPGELLSGRFRVKELVQSGGMGDVYLAEDLIADVQVAVKTLRSGAASPERFEREAARLSELQHPGIPRYITHDLATAGVPYLVMEWLEGVDLATHLRRSRLGLRTAIRVLRSAADAVAYAHKKGVVHRDLNPSNLFLVGDDSVDVRVLDFGVARLERSDEPLTAAGAQIGTPGYMAPEQIEGQGNVGPAADIFALGCVLYEMVTGQRAFYAPTIRELLARMVGEDPPSPRELNRSIPPELEALLGSMLHKEPASRPQDCTQLMALLDTLPPLDDALPTDPFYGRVSPSEQQVTSLIVLRSADETTFERARRAAEPHGMPARWASDDTIVIATHGAGTAGDHASRAARCALAVQRATRAHQMAMSTGLSQQAGDALSGRAFDAALVSLLLKDGIGSQESDSRGPCLWLDENTAALLDSRFDVRVVEQGYLLRGLRETYEPTRTVLGRKTRCVGRKRELSMLEATLAESFEDRVASSILVTGPPGIGKSRLATEITKFARRAVPGIQIFRGGSDAMTAGAPFGALARSIQRACRMRDAEPDSLRRSKLHERLRPIVPPEDFQRVAEFLGQMLGITSERGEGPQIEAARRDAVLRGDQMLRAAEEWLRSECKASPVLVILDDFHWGDLPTAKFIDAALRNLAELPLVVLALARPEVHEIFPKLWVKRGVTELRLSGLSQRAAREMIEEVLGPSVPAEIMERIITRAQGNPFWIEELLRAEDAGQGENVPDRVVLLAQSRIEQQTLDERRLLKAASVFGRQFWLGGAKTVLGPQSTNRVVDAVLHDLVENEFIMEHELSRLGGEREFQFSSGLLRDAAYSLLGEEEREQAHLRAATWLEKNGDSDPLAVALHFTLGGEPDRAKPHYLNAAEQALAGDDLDGALSCAEEGLSAGATGREAVRLRLVHAEASKWRGDNATAFRSAQAAFARAEEGTAEWFRAAAEAAVAAGKTGKKETSLAIAKELLESRPKGDAHCDHGAALSRVATQLVFMGKNSLARGLLDAVQQANTRVEPDPHVMGFFHEARAVLAGATDDPVGRIEYAERAVEHFEDAGDLRNACLALLSQGFAEVEFGANREALGTLQEALAIATQMSLDNSIPVARAQLGRALARLGRGEEASSHLQAATRAFDRQKNLFLAGMSRVYLAETQAMSGQVDLAIQTTERAEAILEPLPPMRRVARGMLAALYAHRADDGDAARALERAEAALADSATVSQSLPVAASLVRVGAAAGFATNGQVARAMEILDGESERVLAIVAEMAPERARQYRTGDPARAFLQLGQTGSKAAGRFEYVQHLMQTVVEQAPLEEPSKLARTTQEDVAKIARESHPVLRNLWITQSYHALSREIAQCVDAQNVNWSTFACWASKTAGISIRNEELPRFVEKELRIDAGHLKSVSKPIRWILELLGLSRGLRVAALATLKQVSEQISEGNKEVYEELAPLFADFVTLMRNNPTENDLEEFVEALRPGPAEEGGQELLQQAFRAWFDARRLDAEGPRAQLILRANCQIGLHEQTRLQVHIRRAMDAPLEVILALHLRQQLPAGVGRLGAFLGRVLGRSFVKEVRALWERIVTRYAMKLILPGGDEISLGEDLPGGPASYPPDLKSIMDAKTAALIERFDGQPRTSWGGSANNWAELSDRMQFIVELFRSRQQEIALFGPPFDVAQEAALSEGRVPDGRL